MQSYVSTQDIEQNLEILDFLSHLIRLFLDVLCHKLLAIGDVSL